MNENNPEDAPLGDSAGDGEDDAQGEHQHRPQCGWPYFYERGRWAKLRHYPTWRSITEDMVEESLVIQGMGSELYVATLKKANSLGFLVTVSGVMVMVLGALRLWWWGYFAAILLWMLVIAPFIRAGAMREVHMARAYRDGWIAGRQQFIHSTATAESPQQLVEKLNHELLRDAEVVMGISVVTAPDDTSGLDQD